MQKNCTQPEEAEKTSQERCISAESGGWGGGGVGNEVCRGEGNKIGEARQPERAGSLQEGASLLGGALRE